METTKIFRLYTDDEDSTCHCANTPYFNILPSKGLKGANTPNFNLHKCDMRTSPIKLFKADISKLEPTVC